MNDFYDDNSIEYFEQTAHVKPDSFLCHLLRYLPPPARILDVGCGAGRDLLWLRKKGYQVKGIERAPFLAKLAGEHSGCEVVVADFETWDFKSVKADGILLIGALVHVCHEKFGRVMVHVTEALITGGKVLLSVKEGAFISKTTDGRIFYLWEDEELRRLLAELNFRVLDFERAVSAIRQKDTWLTYILEKVEVGKANNNLQNRLGETLP